MTADPNEVDALIDQAIAEAGEEFTVAGLAGKLLAKLQEQHDDALDAWLHARAGLILSREIGDRMRLRPRSPQRETRARRFAKDAAEGRVDRQLNPYYKSLQVADDNTKKRACDMTKGDHEYVAASFGARSNTFKMLSAFHDAVAKRIPTGKRTSDVLGEEEYTALRDSILAA